MLEDTITGFDRMYECDRRTETRDRQTDRETDNGIGRASIASRRKNVMHVAFDTDIGLINNSKLKKMCNIFMSVCKYFKI